MFVDFSVLFAFILIYFVLKSDWSNLNPKIKWFPYFAVAFLSLFLVHKFLLLINIDVFAQMKGKNVLEMVFNSFKSKNQ